MKEIKIGSIHPHPKNPRKNLGDLTELISSIRAFGVLQNLTVVPDGTNGYTVICGHRRLAAAEEAGLETVPCIVTDNMDERTQVSIMLLENMQRSDLTIQEEAHGFQMMLELGSSVADIVKETGLSETKVRHRIKMNELDQDLLSEKMTGQVSINDLIKLEQIKDLTRRNEVLGAIGTNNFEWRLAEAIKEEKRSETIKNIKALRPDLLFATGYHWEYNTVGELNYGASQAEIEQFIQQLEEQEGARKQEAMICEKYSNCFSIAFERAVDQEKQEEDPEKIKEKRKLQKRLDDLKNMRDKLFDSWEHFISEYCSKSETYIRTNEKTIIDHLISGLVDGNYDIAEKAADVLNIEVEDDAINVIKNLQERPWATLAAAAYSSIRPSMYQTTWLYLDGSYAEEQAGPFIETSEYLENLGYKVSDDEKAFIGGTSRLYGKAGQK